MDPFDLLPAELWAKILQDVSNYKDKFNAAQVGVLSQLSSTMLIVKHFQLREVQTPSLTSASFLLKLHFQM